MCLSVVSAGCRDLEIERGERFGDRHVLSGRSASEGGPVITAAEQSRGWFFSRTEDVAPLEEALRGHVDGRLEVGDDDDITNELTAFAEGTVKVSTPDRGGWADLPATLRAPFATIDTNDYRREYIRLCEDPLLGEEGASGGAEALFPARGPREDPCDPLALGKDLFLGLDADTLLEQVAFKLERRRIGVEWVEPHEYLWGSDGGRIQPTDPPGDCCNGCSSGFVCRETGYTCFPRADGGLGGGPACEWEGDRACRTTDDCRIESGALTGQYAWCIAGSCRFDHRLRIREHGDHDPDAPVLRVHLPFDVHTDLIDIWATWLVGAADITRLDAFFRLQPVACRDCDTDTGERALDYRGPRPTGNLHLSDTGLDVHVRGTQTNEVSFYPSVLCVLLPGCVFATPAGQDLVEVAVSESFNRTMRNSAEALERMLRIPRLERERGELSGPALRAVCEDAVEGARECDLIEDVVGDDAWQVLSDNIALDLALAEVQVNDDTGTPAGDPVPLGAEGGVWTDRTTQAIARGGVITSITIDSSDVAAACGTCGGASPHRLCPLCDLCALFPPDDDGTPPDICEFGPMQVLEGSRFTIPPSPEIAKLTDSAPNFAAEIRGVFTRPLEDLSAALPPPSSDVMACDGGGPSPVRYEWTDYCSPDVPSASSCPAGQTGGRFGFAIDPDRDAVFAAADNCPTVCNPEQDDGDGDGVGDACDTCRCTASPITRDSNGDGVQDPCDCDIDGDGCSNDYLVAPIAGCGVPSRCARSVFVSSDGSPLLAETYDTNEHGCEVALTPGTACEPGDPVAGVCADTDADRIPNDCDADDDGDGVLDGVDNCRLVPNPGQADENEDGMGDACDCLCPGGGSSPACRPGGPGSSGGGGGSGRIASLAHLTALIPLRSCWADGPSCPSFLTLDCATSEGRCTSLDTVLKSFGPRGELLSYTPLQGVPLGLAGSAGAIPDLDGDGLMELALGATFATPCVIDGQCVSNGSVALIGSRDGSALSSLPAPHPAEAFGASIAGTGSLLFVGAPLARDPSGAQTGAVYRIRLAQSGPVYEEAFYGESEGERFGETLVLVDDLDGDGYAEGLLVGAPQADVHGKRDAGRIDVLSLGGVVHLRLEGPFAGGQMGRQLTTVLPDAFEGPAGSAPGVAAGIPDALGGRGAVVFFTWRGHRRWVVPGPDRDARLGASLSRAADFDGDGLSELAAGAPGASGGDGAVLFLGHLGREVDRIDGHPGDGLGERLAAPGDIDGDGLLELLVSRPGPGLITVVSGAGGQPPGDVIDAPF